MLPDPVVFDLATVSKSLNRVRLGTSDATYQTADNALRLRVSHQVSKSRTRRMIRLEVDAQGENPATGTMQRYTTSVYLVVDEPSFVFERGDIEGYIAALIDCLGAGTPTTQSKFLGNEV